MKTHSFTVKTLGTVLLLSTAVIGGSTANAAPAVTGDILAAYQQPQVRASFGPARDIARCNQNGGCLQVFRHGKIYQHPQYGTHTVPNGPISRYYEHHGGHMGVYGYPTSSVTATATGTTLTTSNGKTYYTFTETAGAVTVAVSTTPPASPKPAQPTPAPKTQPIVERKTLTVEQQIRDTAQEAFGTAGAQPISDIYRPFPEDIQVQRFTGGVITYTKTTGPIAMHGMVYDHWWKAREYSDFKNREGLPTTWHKTGDTIYTQFEHTQLYWDPHTRLARTTQNLGPHDALTIGDSQVWDNSWVGQGLRAAGYTPTMYRCGGTGFIADRPGTCPSYTDGVINNKWALPSGNPGIIYLDASGNDTYHNSQESVRVETVKTIEKLKQMYPNSTIVLGGILSKEQPHHARRHVYNESARTAAAQTGVLFLDTRGWLTTYRLYPYMADDLHLKDQDQWRLADPFKNALKNLLATQKSTKKS